MLRNYSSDPEYGKISDSKRIFCPSEIFNEQQVAQRYQEVSGTLARLYVVVQKLGVSRAADPIGDNVL